MKYLRVIVALDWIEEARKDQRIRCYISPFPIYQCLLLISSSRSRYIPIIRGFALMLFWNFLVTYVSVPMIFIYI